MTRNEWMNIAGIIIASIAALFSYLQLRVTRAMAKPVVTQESASKRFARRIKGLIKEYWAVMIGLVVPVVGVLWEVFGPVPFSRISLLFIFVYTVFLSVQLSVLIVVVALSKRTTEAPTLKADSPPDPS